MSALLRRPFIAGLAVLATALALLLAFEIADASRSRIPSGPTRKVAAAPAKLLPPVTQTPADQAYPETVERPLFTPTRRPAPAQAVAGAPAFRPGQFQLLGVIIAGNTKTAMLREKASGRIHRLEVGREVNGIRVATIDRDTVTLAQGGETEVVPMQVQKGGAVPAAATGPFAQSGAPAGHAPPVAQVTPPGQQPQPPHQLPPASAALLGIPPQPPPPASAQATMPGTPLTPLSPEELLARRRARRAQSNQ